MSIIGSYPATILNGQVEDATVVMSLFAWVQAQVNGNACAATSGSSLLKGDGAGSTTAAVAGTDYLAPTSGLIFDFAGTVAPTGFLLCDGSAVSRVTYANLFNAIGTTWGAGDGSTTFNIPDLRRRTTIGSGGVQVAGPGTAVGNTGGEETHVLTTAELAAHNHGVTDPGHVHGVTDPTHSHTYVYPQHANTRSGGPGDVPQNDISQSTGASATGVSINSAVTGITTNNNGSGNAHNNMQPSAVVTKIIKT